MTRLTDPEIAEARKLCAEMDTYGLRYQDTQIAAALFYRLLDEVEALRADLERLRELLQHMWVHDGYAQNGYLKMTTAQKHLYCDCVGADFSPLSPDFGVDVIDAARKGEPNA